MNYFINSISNRILKKLKFLRPEVLPVNTYTNVFQNKRSYFIPLYMGQVSNHDQDKNEKKVDIQYTVRFLIPVISNQSNTTHN